MKPWNLDEGKLAFGQVLEDAGQRMYEAAKQRASEGAEEEAELLMKAAKMMKDAARLPAQEFMAAAKSIGNAVYFGTAAIAEEQARKFWQDLVKNSLGFAVNILGGVMDLSGLGGTKKKSAKKKS